MIKISSFTLLIILVFSACTTNNIYSVSTDKLDNEYTNKQMQNSIVYASKKLGWKVKSIVDNKITVEYILRNKHKALVDIRYSDSIYSINYLDSENLKYDGESIHNVYNKWILDLEKEININLEKISVAKKLNLESAVIINRYSGSDN